MINLGRCLLNSLTGIVMHWRTVIVCFCCLLVTAASSTEALADEKYLAIQITSISTKIENVSRDSYDGMTKVASSDGAYFTQAGFAFKMNNQDGHVALKKTNCLEAKLLENIGVKVTLLLLDGVDGLIVGLLPPAGDGCVETILATK